MDSQHCHASGWACIDYLRSGQHDDSCAHCQIYKPPIWPRLNYRPCVFLAGSIEMGLAEDWQTKVTDLLPDHFTVLNPRRDDWDPSWIQHKDNPQFREQVEWELRGLETCDLVALYLDPMTKSPVSLLEFGLFSHKMVVCCPEGFWRKGNVDIVCERYRIRQVDSLDELVTAIKRIKS